MLTEKENFTNADGEEWGEGGVRGKIVRGFQFSGDGAYIHYDSVFLRLRSSTISRPRLMMMVRWGGFLGLKGNTLVFIPDRTAPSPILASPETS